MAAREPAPAPRLPFPPVRLGLEGDTGEPVDLAAEEIVRHLAVFGTTGTGKTSLFLALALQLMDRGRGFIVCTTKHDPALPRALAWAAWRRSQLWRLRLFDPMHPVHAYNPISTRNPVILARLYHSQLPRIEPGSEAQHYHDLAMEFLLVACRAVLATGLRHVPDDLLQVALNWDLAKRHLGEHLRRINAQDLLADLDAFFRRFYRRRNGQDEFQVDRAREALSGLTAAITQLEIGPFERFLGEPTASVDLLQACRRGLWVYLGLPRSMTAGEGQLGRLFLTDLIATLDEIQSTEGRLAHAPFVIILDEFPSYALPEFATVFEQARSAGVGLVMGSQTVSGLSDRAWGLSEAFRDRILGNCAHIVSFRVGPGEGAEYLARYVGRTDRQFLQASQTESHGRTYSPLDIPAWLGLTHRTDQRMGFTGYRLAKDAILEGRVLTHAIAPRGEAVWLSQKGSGALPFRLRTAWAAPEEAPHGWAYRDLCPKFDAQPAPPLNLGTRIRQELYRRTVAPAAGPAAHAGQMALPTQQPRPSREAPRGTSGRGREGGTQPPRRRRPPRPESFFFSPPQAPAPSTSQPPPASPTTPPPSAAPDSSQTDASQIFLLQDSDEEAVQP